MFVATIFRHPRRLFIACTAVFIAAGCANAPVGAQLPLPLTEQTEVRDATRLGRYRLVEIGADIAQRDLMEQIVSISTPDTITATVADALRLLLLRTGYGLCESIAAETSAFSRMPLPTPHYHLGPIRLRDALHVLAGPAWVLEIDDAERQVCFSLNRTDGGSASTFESTAGSNHSGLATEMATREPEASTCSGSAEADEDGPPFTPLSIERHGHEYTLFVNSACSGSAIGTHELYIGDIEVGWRLTGLSATAAEFDVAGRRQQIMLR